jgi:hypothetical protein
MKLPTLSRSVVHNPTSKFDFSAGNLALLPADFNSNPCDDCIGNCLSYLGGSPDLCRYGPCRRPCGVDG